MRESTIAVAAASDLVVTYNYAPLIAAPIHRAARNVRDWRKRGIPLPAGINRHTGRPHEHKREIARRTTNPGTDARRAAMAAI